MLIKFRRLIRSLLLWILEWNDLEEKREALKKGKEMIDHWINVIVPEHAKRQEQIRASQLDLQIQIATLKGPYETLSKKLIELQNEKNHPKNV